jgi:hypothetical protein
LESAPAKEAPKVNWKSARDASPMRKQRHVFDAKRFTDIHPPHFLKK